MAGEFFSWYFKSPTLKTNGEADVCCPFEHDKGFDTRPSAHINMDKGLFHCKTCHAEGRNSGMSEVGFISSLYGISYEQAIMYLDKFSDYEELPDVWETTTDALMATEYADYLRNERGLNDDTIRKYQLGYTGDGIRYPILVYGQLCDVRTYQPDGSPKMRSRKGASPLLFPFDHWIADDRRDTLLCAGENDTLLARQLGFNALCVTGGEGTFPDVFLHLFKQQNVYICYDMDAAGINASKIIAYKLHQAGASVHLVTLSGLTGEKSDKDITDAIVKRKLPASYLSQIIGTSVPFNEDMAKVEKNKAHPLVNLWDVPHGRNHNRDLSCRVVMAGQYDMPMRTPSAIEWRCNGAVDKNATCMACPLSGKSGHWVLDVDNLHTVMELVDVNSDQQKKAIHKFIHMPTKCPNGGYHVMARKAVHKVIFVPDVETDYKDVEQYAYIIGDKPEDGQRYRTFFRSYAHPLDDQRVMMVVHQLEESDNALNTFQMTSEIYENLKVFQGDPFEKMRERVEQTHALTRTFKPPDMIVHAVNIMYHSPLKFKMNDVDLKGYPEGLIVGESRTGKSETAKRLMEHYKVGNMMAVKGATTAGLLGGAERMTSGGFRIAWGAIPRNHKGIVILDEMSGMQRDVMAMLTDMRSSGYATVQKIAHGRAPAQTRLLWLSNPRVLSNGTSKDIREYPSGVDIMLDLVGSDEDIARFDFCMLIVREEGKYFSPLDKPVVSALPTETYRNLIYWAWSRTEDQIIFDETTSSYCVQTANHLNASYDTRIKFFGNEAWKKLARIAVACAGATFSTDDGANLVVKREHIDWAAEFLKRCYDNDLFRLREYVKERRLLDETNESVNQMMQSLLRNYKILMSNIQSSIEPIPSYNLQMLSGLDRDKFSQVINTLCVNGLIRVNKHGVEATRRFRQAYDAVRKSEQKLYMKPLTQGGAE
jgi:5S rRNA maturation endonuclease (ribonuclease M5)